MTESTSPEANTGATHAGLKELLSVPLISAILERRTRRVSRGSSIRLDGFEHESNNEPLPLGPLEESVLIAVATGITGVTTHDGFCVPGGTKLGTPFMHVVARAAASADNCQATRFFLINDDGIWLLKRPSGRESLELLRDLPPKWQDWTERDWLNLRDQARLRVAERRIEFPRKYPYYLGCNVQISNAPGSTILLPLVDCTRQYINALLVLCSEPDGTRPAFIDDWRTFHPRGFVEWMAKLSGMLGLTQKIPYQPIGGLKWVRNGYVSTQNVVPLGFARTLFTDLGAYLHLQNLMLVSQAMGLGAWVHPSVFPPYLFHQDSAKGWHGLGFRMVEPSGLSPTPPVPASQPNPVGIDGILEGLCPPYVANMAEAVDQVIEEKYGADGCYSERAVFSRAYRDPHDADRYLKDGAKYSSRSVQYVKDVCNYILDTYGRFPAHVDAWYAPGVWLQLHHLELEYYEKYFDPAQYTRQLQHDTIWHSR